MRLLVRHVMSEFLRALLLATAVLTGLLVLFTVLGLQREAERYGTDVGTLARSLPYLLPYLLCFSLPTSFLVAGVLAFGRLEGAGEVSAMRASGVRLTTITGPVLAVAFGASLFLLVLVEWGIGWGFARAGERVMASGREALLLQAESGRTLRVDSPERSWRIHTFGGEEGRAPLAIVEFRHGAPGEVVLARNHSLEVVRQTDVAQTGVAQAEAGRQWDVLRFRLDGGAGRRRPGWTRILRPGTAVLAESGELAIALESAAERRKKFPEREFAKGLSENVREAVRMRAELAGLERAQLTAALELAAEALAGGVPSRETAERQDRARRRVDEARQEVRRRAHRLRFTEMEIHRKISMAFAPLALVLFGVPLGLRLARGGMLAGFAVGIAAIALVYYPLWISGQILAVSGTLPAVFSVWAAPVLVGGGGAVWLSRMV